MLTDFDRALFPGLRDNLTFMETATPLTLESFTLNHQGAIYGWAVTPNQTGTKRLAHDTPIEGLYLSGHWTHEGPASFRVILSGIMTGRLVLENAGLGDTVPTFRPGPTCRRPLDRATARAADSEPPQGGSPAGAARQPRARRAPRVPGRIRSRSSCGSARPSARSHTCAAHCTATTLPIRTTSSTSSRQRLELAAPRPWFDSVRRISADGVVTTEGEEWHAFRQMLEPEFVPERVTAFAPVIVEAT